MFEFTCLSCGKVVQMEKEIRERKFCDRQCYGKFLKGKKMEPVFVQRVSRNICQKGYDQLVAGICNRAAMDLREYAPGTWAHDDAERFFRSQYFTDLTDMDGEEVLAKLQRKKARNKNGRR